MAISSRDVVRQSGPVALEPLITRGRSQGHSFALETQGSLAAPWFASLDWLILSPKPPSSRMPMNWDALDTCIGAAGDRPRSALKIVIFDDADYEYAKLVSTRYSGLPIYLQVGNLASNGQTSEPANIDRLLERLRWLIGRVTEDCWFDVTVLPQLHVLACGHRRRI